jgi:hypothetical protein
MFREAPRTTTSVGFAKRGFGDYHEWCAWDCYVVSARAMAPERRRRCLLRSLSRVSWSDFRETVSSLSI